MARSSPKSDRDWWRDVAIAIGTGLLISSILEQWGPKRKPQRVPGKVVPSVVPAGLPAFPSTAWEPYLPLKPAITRRAAQLLFPLWGQGEGATVTEQTDGEWVTYQAQIHQEGSARKKGVGAWRLKGAVSGAVA